MIKLIFEDKPLNREYIYEQTHNDLHEAMYLARRFPRIKECTLIRIECT